ncbi:hypothetical protein SAMN04489733_0838 [Amycolatopsis keratiniphila]|nr:hypothetical protein SAMN04489733_0838 [Amycolatopsis keratiniphila]
MMCHNLLSANWLVQGPDVKLIEGCVTPPER